MKKTETILFPTDFSDVSLHALYFAIDMAKREKHKLILLHVVDAPYCFNMENESQEVDLIVHDLVYFSKKKLEGIATKIKKGNAISVTAVTYMGETTESIIRAVNDFHVTKIIMGTKIEKDLFFKSSSFNIVKNTSVPLLTINMGNTINNFKNILFPFNERIMTLKKADDVIQLAQLYNSKVVLLGVSKDETPEKKQEITDNMLYVKNLFEENNITSEIHYITNKNYSKAILEYCNNNEIDLITVANNLPTALNETLKYSHAKTVINNAEIPVFTIPILN